LGSEIAATANKTKTRFSLLFKCFLNGKKLFACFSIVKILITCVIKWLVIVLLVLKRPILLVELIIVIFWSGMKSEKPNSSSVEKVSSRDFNCFVANELIEIKHWSFLSSFLREAKKLINQSSPSLEFFPPFWWVPRVFFAD